MICIILETYLKSFLNYFNWLELIPEDFVISADPGFDLNELRSICIQEEIEIKPKPVNTKKDEDQYQLCEKRVFIEHTQMHAWIKALLSRFESKLTN